MKPAWPALALSARMTLPVTAQGLFIALFAAELAGFAGRGGTGFGFFAIGGLLAFLFAAAGLAAGLLHSRGAGPAMAMQRSLWPARERVLLVLFMAGDSLWTAGHVTARWPTLAPGAATAVVAFMPILCAAMSRAGLVRALDCALPGWANGVALAAALAGARAPALVPSLSKAALALSVLALAAQILRYMGGRRPRRRAPWYFIGASFGLPILLIGAVLGFGFGWLISQNLLALAFVVQMLGLLVGRWGFFARVELPTGQRSEAVS